MSFVKFNVQEELQKMAKGQRTKCHPQTLAVLLLGTMEPQRKAKRIKRMDDSLDFLERLYRLKDERGL
jgi:hypothetical protein